MKRIDYIKKELCRIINNCNIQDFESFLRGLEESDSMFEIAEKVFIKFDEEVYNQKNNKEKEIFITSGQYDKEFIVWLNQNIENKSEQK